MTMTSPQTTPQNDSPSLSPEVSPALVAATALPRIAVDLYRDIHKGIRAELFAVTTLAGSIDPAERAERVRVAGRVRDLAQLLVEHAEHEDDHIEPTMQLHLPALAEQIATDHATIDGRLLGLQALADTAADATRDEQRGWTHQLYLELASFTGAYLQHQDVEERVVMPALEAAVGPEETGKIHQAIVSSIPPAELVRSLGIMIPAMNVEDRVELLGGMQAGAPAEVFAGIWGLVGSLLPEADHAALGSRLGIA